MRLAILPIAVLSLWLSTSLISAQEVVFQRQAAVRGDQSRQQLSCDLDLTMSIRQGGQIIQQQKQLVQRQQQRELTILQAQASVPQQAQVSYQDSVVTLKSADQEPQSSKQPVTGKTYLVTRQGDKLSITYPDGTQPPEAELIIVQENMDTFGLPNPIATFFDGRKVRVGQTLQLPTELARDLLGFAATGDAVSQFNLKLASIRPAASAQASPQAVFEITLKAQDPEATGVSMALTGQMIMEVQTCRSLAVTLTGPVVASEMHGPDGGQYELHSQGQIDVAVKADYLKR